VQLRVQAAQVQVAVRGQRGHRQRGGVQRVLLALQVGERGVAQALQPAPEIDLVAGLHADLVHGGVGKLPLGVRARLRSTGWALPLTAGAWAARAMSSRAWYSATRARATRRSVFCAKARATIIEHGSPNVCHHCAEIWAAAALAGVEPVVVPVVLGARQLPGICSVAGGAGCGGRVQPASSRAQSRPDARRCADANRLRRGRAAHGFCSAGAVGCAALPAGFWGCAAVSMLTTTDMPGRRRSASGWSGAMAMRTGMRCAIFTKLPVALSAAIR
jgi:hypothetical protein